MRSGVAEAPVLAAAGDEASRAALGLAGRERFQAERELLRQGIAQRKTVLAPRAQPVIAQALLRKSGDLARQRERGGERLAVLDDAVREAELERLCGADGAA